MAAATTIRPGQAADARGLARARLEAGAAVAGRGARQVGRPRFRAGLASGFDSPYAGPHLLAPPPQPGGLPAARGGSAPTAAFADPA